MAVKASNQITIIDVVDAYSIMMTSESYTFAGNTTSAEVGSACSTGIVAFCGSTQCSNVTVGTVICPTGISAVVTDNNSSFVTITFTVTATISNSCEAVIPVSVDSVTINKKMSFAVALSGADGVAGSSGVGVSSIEEQYYLSTSKSTQSGGSWTTTPPTWSSGMYIWTRSKITYTSGDPTYTEPICDTSWEAINLMQIGSRNYLRNGNFASTYLQNNTNTLITDGFYVPTRWYCYNGGIEDPEDNYHAHIDTETFGFPVIEFNESNGVRCWKALSTCFRTEASGNTNQHGPIDTTKTYRLSLDVYATGTGTHIFGGFHYKREAMGTAYGFWDPDISNGMYSHAAYWMIESDDISVGEWSRVSMQLNRFCEDVTPDDYITFYIYSYGFSSNEILYIKDVSLNVSDVTTAWTPAIEDEEEKLDNVQDDIVSYYELSNAQLTTETDRITAMVESTYVTQTDYNEFVEETSSVIEQTAEDVSMIFTQTTANTSILDTLSSEVESQFSEINKYITFGTSGITISSNNSTIQLVVDNSGIIFSNNGVTIGSWDGTDFYTGNIWVEVDEYARFGNYAFLPQSDGSLKFMKVGD